MSPNDHSTFVYHIGEAEQFDDITLMAVVRES